MDGFHVLSNFSIKRIREILRPSLEEIVDDILLHGERHLVAASLTAGILLQLRHEISHEVAVHVRKYFVSLEFRETCRNEMHVLFREYGLRDIAQSPVARNTDLHTSLHQSPSFENHTAPLASFPVLKDPLKNIVDSSPQSKSVDCLSENSGDRKRASNPLEPSNPKEKTRKTLPTFRSSSEYPSDTPVDADAATEMVAGSIFSKIRFQYEAYMKKAQTDTDRHIIRCQAYSVVRAKCRRSSEIKTRVGELVLEFMQNDISSNNVISEIELNEIRSVMYDSASKYKFSLTSTV